MQPPLLKKNEVTLGPVVLPDGRALIAVVTNLVPAHQGTLEEVRTEVKNKATAVQTAEDCVRPRLRNW